MPSLRESMSGVDLAWLRMERPTNPMMVIGVLTLATRLHHGDVRALLESRLLRFQRFRELPRHDVTGTHWESDPAFDLDAHVHRMTLPPRAGQLQLEAAVSELASTQLDPRRPLWQIHVIERYRKGSAVIARFHHCYADGIALLRVLGTLTDDEDAASIKTLEGGPAVRSATEMLAGLPLVGGLASSLQSIGAGTIDLVSASLHALTHLGETATIAKQVSAASAELARVALLPEDPPTPLRAPLTASKQVAWTEPLPLDEVKTIAHALDCTVNDVLLSTVAGALGSHLRTRGFATDEIAIRALVPVNMRPLDAPVTLGNQFGLVFATLPIGERDPIARLTQVHREMQQLKDSAQPLMSLWLLLGMGMLPEVIETQAIDVFTKKATLVISNVPGPQHPLKLAGARIDQELFWVPQAGSLGLGVSLFTYDGRVSFGVMADRNVLSDPKSVVRLFAAEFEKLLLCVISMSPRCDARDRENRPGGSP